MLKCRSNILQFVFLLGSLGGLYPSVIVAQNFEVEQANVAFNQQKYTEAVRWSQQALSRDSLNSAAYQILAASNLALMKFTEAENVANRGLKHFPKLNPLIWFKSEALLQKGLLNEALDGYQKLLTVNSNISKKDINLRIGLIYQALGGQYYQQDKFELAEDNLIKAKLYMPDSLSSYTNLALVYTNQKKWDDALHVIDEGRERFPANEYLIKMRVNALYETRNFGEVLSEYESLYRKNPDNLDNAITYAELLLAQGKRQQSESVYEKLLDNYPNERKIYESLIGFYKARNNIMAQRGALRKMYVQFPEDASIMQRIAETYVAEQKWEMARAAFDSARVFGGDITDLSILTADTFIQQDSLEAAHQIYEQALLEKPNQVQILQLKGSIEQELGYFDQSVFSFEKLVEVNPSAESYEQLGIAYLLAGENEQGLKSLETSASKNSRSATVYYEIARIYHQNGKKTEAFDNSLWSLKLTFANLQALQKNIAASLQEQGNLLEMPEANDMAASMNENNFIAKEAFRFFTSIFQKEKVIPELNSLKNEYKQSGQLYFMISSYYLKSGLKEEGIALLKESVVLSPKLAEAHVALGDYYLDKEDFLQANISFEKAISINPEFSNAYKKLIDLHREQETLNQLCNRWIARFRVNSEQPTLKEFLIEALHKADRYDEATELIKNDS